ncbi:lysine-specific demethylase 5A [Neocloeon triangulifer]|uniref:lysine-specific demethylase 5A n=1 Tax=Neocloeon triangulifer TaxID=2078957 RepID=UPI00286F42B9|nr:lysine-specific demethylase 5A [Neocloeon triangulifer]
MADDDLNELVVNNMLKNRKYNPEVSDAFSFKRPPDCPVYTPTAEEFENPFEYIAKIRDEAVHTGICKIRPPKGWEPPFCVDVDNFKFTPRVQQLNELEAKTRIRLNFIEQIGKFWNLQGTPCTIPMIDKHAVDYFTLYQEVQAAGGLSQIKNKQWLEICKALGFAPKKSIAIILKDYYEKYLHPFDLFKKSNNGNAKQEHKPAKRGRPSKKNGMHGNYSLPNSKASSPPSSPEKEPVVEEAELEDYERFQYIGGCHKMAGFRTRKKEPEAAKKPRGRKSKFNIDPLAKYVCKKCSRGDKEDKMLLCDGCDDSYHTFCLVPPLAEIPEGDWRCPICVDKEVSKPFEAFGFEQAKREYSLYEFGKMADEFKCQYFNMPVHTVPLDLVEREYWRIVGTIDEDVTVEYGADLHTLDHGSGFPTHKSHNLSSPEMPYVRSGWNLNNLPVLSDCILSHIDADISGMKVPWMYVGMCFSTFCWHNEDHWSYSINYLHWGEPKTWYGVPGAAAPEFEDAMRSKAPELFENQTDLLHQLVTIMNPNLLMERGVPVFRTDQQAGEFVITFPRSYHAGFNQGYNFAEAVNFAPPDWLTMGRECIDHYAEQRRYCVFSHDELVCKMASKVSRMSVPMALAVCKDMNEMVRLEVALRKEVAAHGIKSKGHVPFETLTDDERQCDFCQTTLFLSAVACKCNDKKMACLRHFKNMCKCDGGKKTLLYRYLESELTTNLKEIKRSLEEYMIWFKNVQEIVFLEKSDKPELSELVELDQEGRKRKYPQNSAYLAFKEAIKEGETTINLCDQLIARRDAQGLGDFPSEDKLQENELKELASKVSFLCCKVAHSYILEDTLAEVEKFHAAAEKIMQSEEDIPTKELLAIVKRGKTMVVWLPEMPQLEQKLKQAQWLDRVRSLESCSPPSTEKEVRELLEEVELLLPTPAVENSIGLLKLLLDRVTSWNRAAKTGLNNKPTIKKLEKLVSEAESIPVHLPDLSSVKDLVKKGRDWMNKYRTMKSTEHPYLEQMDILVNIGRNLQVHLDPLGALEDESIKARGWLEKASRIFLKKNSQLKLIEALNPRKIVGIQSNKGKRKKLDSFTEKSLDEPPLDNETIFANFLQAKQREVQLMITLREKNLLKRTAEGGDAKFCICNKPCAGNMLDCELCKELYHPKCLLNSKLTGKGRSAILQQPGESQTKYLCPTCLRTRRPRIETVLPLLVDLTKLPARLHEGETLQCLTENAIHWQEKAKAALANEEVASALAKLSVMNQRVLEAEARRKTERIISSELKKAANNPELQNQLPLMPPMANVDDMPGTDITNNMPKEEYDLDCDLEKMKGSNNSDHAYSSMNIARLKHSRKSPLVPRHPPTTLHLQESTRFMLESLMMEGDLLEVSLDETHHIWRILHASNPVQKQNFEKNNPDLAESKQNLQPLDLLEKPKPKPRKPREPGVKNKLRVVLGANKEKLPRKPMVGRKGKRKVDGEEDDVKPVKKWRKMKAKDVSASESEEADAEERCNSDTCVRPSGDEVNWVQCDGCSEWFHLICEGLSKADVNSTDEYICRSCHKLSLAIDADPKLEPKEEEEETTTTKVEWTDLGV